MPRSLSALDFFRASTKSKSTSSGIETKPTTARRSPARSQKGIQAACILPTVIFLGTEMFTPAEKEPLEKPSIDVPEIVITTADEQVEQSLELPAS